MDLSGLSVGIVVSRWNELVTEALLKGAIETFQAHGNPAVTIAKVPGAWEIPVVAKAMIEAGHNGVVAVGCILQGATPHAKQLAADVGSALMTLQMDSGVPVTWGILTPETQEQALERAGLKMGNKGREASLALIETISLLREVRS
ncbi:MAG: 6,7-dimethyl-8-ribityllumazine synthase [Fimbriimonadaceae bacterium]|nr:6,7-dimethyl-8-ribityllumazine synthase [Fimbriimonadaceae bacterium]